MQETFENIVFEIGELYRNRLGWYKALEINGDNIRVQYECNGIVTTLSIEAQKRILSNIRREEKATGPIVLNRETFFSYADECNKSYRFGHDLELYREIISKHRNSDGLDSLLNEDSFYTLIMKTLEAWNMNQRGAQLTTLDNLKGSIRAHRLGLLNLYQYKLPSITAQQIKEEIMGLLQNIFGGLQVMESKRRIVGVSKALHFLLPDLVMPIDGSYTLPYFYGYNKNANTTEGEFNMFADIFMETYEITKKLNLTQEDVDSQDWNTSIPKLIDDAIIGLFCVIRRKLGI